MILESQHWTVAHSEYEETFVIQDKEHKKIIAECSYFDGIATKEDADKIATAIAMIPEVIKQLHNAQRVFYAVANQFPLDAEQMKLQSQQLLNLISKIEK